MQHEPFDFNRHFDSTREQIDKDRRRRLVEVLVILGAAVAVGVLIVALSGCFDATGANHDAALDNARTHIKKLNADARAACLQEEKVLRARASANGLGGEDIDLGCAAPRYSLVECNAHDRDSDGYLSCTISDQGTRQQIECAGEALVFKNTGCRDPKLTIHSGG